MFMRLTNFLKDKLIFIALSFLVSGFSAFLLYMVNANIYFILFAPCIYLVGCILSLLIEFLIKNSYYKKVRNTLDSLDKKFLLSEIIERAGFYEGNLLYDILKSTSKAMNDEVAKYHTSSGEYREYIEMWVHEIKTPIAGAKLICENTGNTEVSSELDRIDGFVEQALFYSRSNNVEKDFIIKKAELKELVNQILRKNAKRLINHKINIETSGLAYEVFTDVKWTDFILQQLIDNSIKYKCNKIRIYSEQNTNAISLFIADNGIGIPKQDIGRVFDKGFTGENGRQFGKATGIGLYLCKKLCSKLGMNISIKSEQGNGTIIEMVFPKSEMYS